MASDLSPRTSKLASVSEFTRLSVSCVATTLLADSGCCSVRTLTWPLSTTTLTFELLPSSAPVFSAMVMTLSGLTKKDEPSANEMRARPSSCVCTMSPGKSRVSERASVTSRVLARTTRTPPSNVMKRAPAGAPASAASPLKGLPLIQR